MAAPGPFSHLSPVKAVPVNRRSRNRRRADTPVADTGSSAGPATILVVDDQDDMRRMLVTALQIDGHEVDEASSAADGLTHLQAAHYDLVLSDYSMPGETGAWMLNEAAREGLLERTVTLIVTAHPDVNDLPNVEIISKPLDLDIFLDQVERILQSMSVEPRSNERREGFSATAPTCAQAFEPSQMNLKVCEGIRALLEECD
jgi:DNA-binding NtrC family response regulator